MASMSNRPDESSCAGEGHPAVTLTDFANRYPSIRKGLVAFYCRRQAADPEMLADEALFRVLRQLLANVQIRDTLEKYCTGVAKLVLHESWRRRKMDALSDTWRSPGQDPLERLDEMERQALLRFCMASIHPGDAEVWRRYHNEDRVALAAELEITGNALRIRVHRAQRAMLATGRRLLGGQ